jgi:hypothetical protein
LEEESNSTKANAPESGDDENEPLAIRKEATIKKKETEAEENATPGRKLNSRFLLWY